MRETEVKNAEIMSSTDPWQENSDWKCLFLFFHYPNQSDWRLVDMSNVRCQLKKLHESHNNQKSFLSFQITSFPLSSAPYLLHVYTLNKTKQRKHIPKIKQNILSHLSLTILNKNHECLMESNDKLLLNETKFPFALVCNWR